MTKQNEDKIFGGMDYKFNDVADSEPHEDGNYRDKAEEEEEEERRLQSRNEEGHSMDTGGRNGMMPDSVLTNMVGAGTGTTQGEAHQGPEGAHVVNVEPHSIQNGQSAAGKSKYPAKSMRSYFSKKAEKWQQDENNWEEIGDEDLIGNAHGNCGKRVFWKGSLDSQGCPTASPVEVKDIFRHSIRILGAYGEDMDGLAKPIQEHEPNFDCKGVVEFQHPTGPGECPPYFIYVDHLHREVSMYIRGLNFLHRRDYVALLNNRKGEKQFDGGYVHHGMFQPAEWATKHVGPVLKERLLSNEGYRLTIVGHSLGAGVAALLTAMFVKDTKLVGVSADLICAVVFAPPRVMSLDLAIKYAPYINSVIYQDDFLPRVSTASVKRIFLVTFALTGVVVFIYWLKQAFQQKAVEDTERLYPPGKIYHFVYKQPGRPGHRPIRARVVPSAEGRFERLILSSSGTATNHSVLKLTKHLKSYNWPEELKDPWLTSVLQTKQH